MLFVNVKQTICKHLDGNAGKLYVIEFLQNNKRKSESMSSVWPIFSPCDLSIALRLSGLQNERWSWYSWLCLSRFRGYCLSLHQNLHFWMVSSISQIEISIILLHVICWFRRAWTCKTYWTTANYKSIRFIVIYCVLISTNVQFSDQNALHDSNQVLPCNRFFLFSARSDCPSPENFWLSIFYLYHWEKAKDLVSVRGFLLVLNSRLVVNNAPTSY